VVVAVVVLFMELLTAQAEQAVVVTVLQELQAALQLLTQAAVAAVRVVQPETLAVQADQAL
jgi:hypothetical protein